MFRFKGLEYQRVITAGVSDGLGPREQVNQLRQVDPARYRGGELQRARSLLFVAVTRARDSLNAFWHGTPSPFLPSAVNGEAGTAYLSCPRSSGRRP